MSLYLLDVIASNEYVLYVCKFEDPCLAGLSGTLCSMVYFLVQLEVQECHY